MIHATPERLSMSCRSPAITGPLGRAAARLVVGALYALLLACQAAMPAGALLELDACAESAAEDAADCDECIVADGRVASAHAKICFGAVGYRFVSPFLPSRLNPLAAGRPGRELRHNGRGVNLRC